VSKLDDAREILSALGLPKAQQNERSALTLLALANILPHGSWKRTDRPMLRIWDIMAFMREKYGKDLRGPIRARQFAGKPFINSNKLVSLAGIPMTRPERRTAETTCIS